MLIQGTLFPETSLNAPSNTTPARIDSEKRRGCVYTSAEAVRFMLDLAGYSPQARLYKISIMEPCFGGGSFLLEIVERLMMSCRCHGVHDYPALATCIRAVELDGDSYSKTKALVGNLLARHSIDDQTAHFLMEHWLHQGDFLLTDFREKFDVVVGNPPYVRLENMQKEQCRLYKARFVTWTDRADMYIPFYEKGLGLLKRQGKLVYICSNRWMKNQYGRKLRQHIIDNYAMLQVIDISSPDLFDKKVTAYPSITLIGKERKTDNHVLYNNHAGSCRELGEKVHGGYHVKLCPCGNPHDTPWIWEREEEAEWSRRLQKKFPLLEDTGCKVGIGVATGADKVYIGLAREIPVENERLLPIAMSRDIDNGSLSWRGMHVVNPYDDNGRLVSLEDYPLLAAYLQKHRQALSERHCARKAPDAWYKTIDKINVSLVKLCKILIPDIKGELMPVVDEGRLYPHHNLYYVLPGPWDTYVLRAFLLSDFCQAQLMRCCTMMNGGALRCQAQYIRQIRLPRYESLTIEQREELERAGIAGEREECSRLVQKLVQEHLIEHHEQIQG